MKCPECQEEMKTLTTIVIDDESGAEISRSKTYFCERDRIAVSKGEA